MGEIAHGDGDEQQVDHGGHAQQQETVAPVHDSPPLEGVGGDGDQRDLEHQGGGEGDEEPPRVPQGPAVDEAGGQEAGQSRGVGQALHSRQPRRPGPPERREDLGGQVVAERGVGRAARVLAGAAGVEAVARLDPHHPVACPRLQTQGQSQRPLGTELVGHGPEGLVVPGQAAVLAAGQADHPASLAVAEGGHGRGQLGVGGESLGRVDRGRGHQLEQVAGEDQDAGSVPRVDGGGQLRRGRARRRGGVLFKDQVAHDQDPAADGHLDLQGVGHRSELDLPAHVASSVAAAPGSQLVG